MAFPSVDDQMAVLTCGCDHLYSKAELRARLTAAREANRPLRVKLGMDPTAPDIHLGHSVVLRKMRQFQDFGHKAVLIIGDYTARVGDPSGRSKTRPMLSDDDVTRNAETYFAQAGKILNTDETALEIRRNSEWLADLNLVDLLKLTSQMTVARMLERDTFAKRYKAGVEIYIHEFLYPLMQGQDSVEIAADVELGGTDQTFNNLVGRDLQRNAGQPPQVVMIMPILVGIDGAEKMSKSLGNTIAVTDPPLEMFSRTMRIADALMANYFKLLTTRDAEEIKTLTDPDQTHPREAKTALGKDIVSQYHGPEAAEAAAREFDQVHKPGGAGMPDDIETAWIDPAQFRDGGIPAAILATELQFAQTGSAAKRLVKQGGFRVNGNTVTDPNTVIEVKEGDVVQRGKREFRKVGFLRESVVGREPEAQNERKSFLKDDMA